MIRRGELNDTGVAKRQHLHFVQSLEPLQGGGLGAAALQLHLQLLKKTSSKLVATRSSTFEDSWPGAKQFVRSGPSKLFYSPQLTDYANDSVPRSDFVHGHGLYVYPNWVFGGSARRHGLREVVDRGREVHALQRPEVRIMCGVVQSGPPPTRVNGIPSVCRSHAPIVSR